MQSKRIADAFENQDTCGKSVTKRSLTGTALLFLSQFLILAISLSGTAVLARVLAPEEFGLVAVVMGVVAVATVFGSLGMSDATIQKTNVSRSEASNVFWVNIGTGAVLSLAFYFVAPSFSVILENEETIRVAQWLSPIFLLTALPTQHQALLRRKLNFKLLCVIQIGTVALANAVSITLALQGAGIGALVALHLSLPISTALASFLFFPWIPSLPDRSVSIRHHLKFGVDLTLFNIATTSLRSVDKILIGASLGAAATGYYSKAMEMLVAPISRVRGPITSAAVPALSRLQSEPLEYRRYFTTISEILATLLFPGIAYLILKSEEVVHIVLGPGWERTGEIFGVLGFAAFSQPLTQILGVVLISRAATRRYLAWGLIHSTTLILCFILAVPYGLMTFVLVYCIGSWLLLPPSIWFCLKGSPVTPVDYLRSLIRPTVATASAILVVMMMESAFISNLAVTTLIFGLTYGVVQVTFRSHRSKIRSFITRKRLL